MIDVPRELVDLVEEHGFQSEWNALIDSIAELEKDYDEHQQISREVVLDLKKRIEELEAELLKEVNQNRSLLDPTGTLLPPLEALKSEIRADTILAPYEQENPDE